MSLLSRMFEGQILMQLVSSHHRVCKIVMDQNVYLGAKCSIYIALVGLLNGQTLPQATGAAKGRIKPVMLAAWRFWPHIHCCTYTFVPAK